MTHSDEAREPPQEDRREIATAEQNGGEEEEDKGKSLAASGSEAGEVQGSLAYGDPSSNGRDAGSGEGEPDMTLASADELFEKGSKAIEEEDLIEAVDSLSRALEIRVAHYGELAPECVMAYYKYGCALLYKAQEEADPLGDVPKNTGSNSSTAVSAVSSEDNESSKDLATDAIHHLTSSSSMELQEVTGDKDKEYDNEESDGDGEDLGEADENESDLDLAWKMLDVARAIAEKSPEDTIEKVNIWAALGEVSMEREDIDTSLNDYLKALSTMEKLVEADNRRIIELNFRICLVLEVGSKIEEAIPYCQKAITLCNSRLRRLREDVPDFCGSGNQCTGNTSSVEEIKVLSGILSELEVKLEDLQQAMTNPKSLFSDVVKMFASKSTSSGVNLPGVKDKSISSSLMGVIRSNFDSSTTSTAVTSCGITHLGVVGRGVKRATVNPISAEPSSKKPSLDQSVERTNSSNSVVIDSTAQDPEAPTK